MLNFPSAEHEDAYNGHYSNSTQSSSILHVSGNGKEIITYLNRWQGDDTVLASIFGYGNGFDDQIVMRERADIIIDLERAPLLFNALNPDYFDVANHVDTVAPYVDNRTPTSRAFTLYAAQAMPESLVGREVGSDTMLSVYYEEDIESIAVIMRGFDSISDTDTIALEAFHANAKRAELIRESLISYYGTETLGL